MPLKKRLVAKMNITTAKIGMNLSSLFSIVKDSIILNFFKMRRNDIGNMNVVPNITARHISIFIDANLQMPDRINIRNIHVGNKIGWNIIDINCASLFIVDYNSLRNRATGMSSCSRYFAMVRLAIL